MPEGLKKFTDLVIFLKSLGPLDLFILLFYFIIIWISHYWFCILIYGNVHGVEILFGQLSVISPFVGFLSHTHTLVYVLVVTM